MYYSLGKKKEDTVKNQIMVNNRGYILHKSNHTKGKRMIIIFVYKKNHPITHPKQVVNVIDLGYRCRNPSKYHRTTI